MIYANFESILAPEDKWKAKSRRILYKNKHKKHCLQLWLQIRS